MRTSQSLGGNGDETQVGVHTAILVLGLAYLNFSLKKSSHKGSGKTTNR